MVNSIAHTTVRIVRSPSCFIISLSLSDFTSRHEISCRMSSREMAHIFTMVKLTESPQVAFSLQNLVKLITESTPRPAPAQPHRGAPFAGARGGSTITVWAVGPAGPLRVQEERGEQGREAGSELATSPRPGSAPVPGGGAHGGSGGATRDAPIPAPTVTGVAGLGRGVEVGLAPILTAW